MTAATSAGQTHASEVEWLDAMVSLIQATFDFGNEIRCGSRVSLSVMDKDRWYRQITLIGRVVEIYDDEDQADIKRMEQHYSGKPHPADEVRVSAWIEIDRWYGRNGYGPFQAA